MQWIDNQAVKQLYDVVLALASETGQVRERLAKACAELHRIDLSLLPEETRSTLEQICGQLKELYPDVQHWADVDENQAIDVAMQIVVLYDALNKTTK